MPGSSLYPRARSASAPFKLRLGVTGAGEILYLTAQLFKSIRISAASLR